jgi:ADP-ribosyl-[dinitrogen reductase] hydrolase
MTTPTETDRYRGCLLGLAAGDAVGTTVEFMSRGSFEPVTDMVGGGPFRLRPGEWTDDTSMALCLAESLLACEGFDARDQMERYCRWWREGYLSSNGRCFDIGTTVSAALRSFEKTGEPLSGSTEERTAGNGSLMRLAPVVLYFAPDERATLEHAASSSRTTHAAREAVDACRLFAAFLLRALAGGSKDEVLAAGVSAEPLFHATGGNLSPRIGQVAAGSWREKSDREIRGTGYVVASLEAAIWSFATTDGFADAILCAANLGDDADTTAAVCGQLAGAFYGASGIPAPWRERLAHGAKIAAYADWLRAAKPHP